MTHISAYLKTSGRVKSGNQIHVNNKESRNVHGSFI